jgi:hypothetical protein
MDKLISKALSPLVEVFAENPVLQSDQALTITMRLVDELRRLHDSGQFHGRIGAAAVHVDLAAGLVALAPPGADCELGGLDGDPELCPPELQGAEPIRLPTAIAAAQTLLSAAGLATTPRGIDHYQVTALLCRLLTGAPLMRYLRSARIRAQIPRPLLVVMDRGLAYRIAEAFGSDEEYLDALQAAGRELSIDKRLGPGISTPAPASTPSVLTPSPELRRKPVPPREDGLPFEQLGHYRLVRRLGGAAWARCTLGMRKHCSALLPSRCCRPTWHAALTSFAASRRRQRRSPGSIILILCRSILLVRRVSITSSQCSTSRDNRWIGYWPPRVSWASRKRWRFCDSAWPA